MNLDTNPLVVAALAASLLLAGCVGSQGDADLAQNSAGEAELTVALEAEGAGEVSHLGLELDRVLAHDANVSLPDGFHDVSLLASHADLIDGGEADRVELASGMIPAGSYDQVLLRLSDAILEAGNGSEDGHDHEGGDDGGHDHGEAGAEAIQTGSLDLPLNVSFEATPEEATEVTFVLDIEESYDGDSFTPTFASVDIVRANETVDTQTDLETRASSDSDVPQDPPASRIAVFAPSGDQIYEPPFDPEDGEFANSPASAIAVGEEVQFSGTPSEAVAQGADIVSHEWDFDDGTTSRGPTAAHAFENPGVYEVELTVEDSYGLTDEHQIRLVTDTEGWTAHVANTSFEESSDDWTTETNAEQTGWALDGDGRDSATAWRAGFSSDAPAMVDREIGYEPGATTILHSPEYQIPEDWTKIGFQVWISGASNSEMTESTPASDVTVTEADPFTVSYTTGSGDETVVGEFAGSQDWTELGGIDVFEELAGETVQFHFTFESQENQLPGGDGWYVDDLQIGGVDLPVHNAHLLEESGDGHDGHDHEH